MPRTSSFKLEQSIARKYLALSPEMDERARRLWAAAETRELGRGGATIVRKATGLDWKTIRRGERDLKEQDMLSYPPGGIRRIRKKGEVEKLFDLKTLLFFRISIALLNLQCEEIRCLGFVGPVKAHENLLKSYLIKGMRLVTGLSPMS